VGGELVDEVLEGGGEEEGGCGVDEFGGGFFAFSTRFTWWGTRGGLLVAFGGLGRGIKQLLLSLQLKGGGLLELFLEHWLQFVVCFRLGL
jgi:hypothetical protein